MTDSRNKIKVDEIIIARTKHGQTDSDANLAEMQDSKSVPSPFMAMPQELRDLVFEELWEHTPVIHVPHYLGSQGRSAGDCTMWFIVRYKGTIGLPHRLPMWLLTSKYMLFQGLERLTANTTWCLDCNDGTRFGLDMSSKKTTPLLMSSMKHLVFSIHVWNPRVIELGRVTFEVQLRLCDKRAFRHLATALRRSNIQLETLRLSGTEWRHDPEIGSWNLDVLLEARDVLANLTNLEVELTLYRASRRQTPSLGNIEKALNDVAPILMGRRGRMEQTQEVPQPWPNIRNRRTWRIRYSNLHQSNGGEKNMKACRQGYC